MQRLGFLVVVALGGAGCTGDIGDSPGPGDPGGAPVAVTITGPDVLPHVQAFADAACGALDTCMISTYAGHDPTASRALDTLVSDAYGERASDNNELGDALAAYALAHMEEFGVMYVIFRQRYNDGTGWDPMEDRGSITQNHYDHVHVSFDETLP